VDIIESKLFSTSTPIKDSQPQVTQESYTCYLTPHKDLDYESPAKIWSNKSDYDKGMEKPYRIPRKDTSYRLDRQSGYFTEISMVPVRLHIHHLDTTKENLLVTGMTQMTEANRIKISTVTSEDTHRSFRYYEGKSTSNWYDTSDRSKPYKRATTMMMNFILHFGRIFFIAAKSLNFRKCQS